MSKERLSSGKDPARIRVGIVNYLNTKPLLYGLEKPPINDRIELVGDYPSRLVDLLVADKIDIGLIPVAAISQLPVSHIIGNYCIGTEGEIASVALFSEVPMNEIREVWLDYQSRSSVALLKWLMKEYWGIHPTILHASDESYIGKIKGSTAGLVIGDRALEQRKVSTFIYDLGSEWKAITGLPFVFAAWVSLRRQSEEFVREFDKANAVGIDHLDQIIAENPTNIYDLRKYYTLHLSYELDEAKRKGMAHFLQVIKEG